jgi:hypothetical protein
MSWGQGRGRIGSSGRGEEVRKGHGRVNIVQILYIHIYKWKKRYLLKLFQEWGRGG